MTATRRLAAILAADVEGYSRLIGTDEEGTLNRLKSIRVELIDPKITQYRGRIVKTTVDGLLVEFTSVVDALRCASEWQRGMAERNADVPTSRIEFRIGINVGAVPDSGLARRSTSNTQPFRSIPASFSSTAQSAAVSWLPRPCATPA